MKWVGFLLQVKKEKLTQYKQHHTAVWPEVLAAYGLMFGYFEAAESFAASLAGMEQEEINAQWQEFMGPYFEALTGRPDQNMIELEEVFLTD
ncbi:MAG: L-rhamnose mutarotase [Anaerolineae bacterium]|nr:L-rhamnose mutarotase [Anaerolineae bacterium]